MHMLIHEAGSEVQSFRLNDFQIWKTNLRQVVFNSSNFFFQNKDVLFPRNLGVKTFAPLIK